MQMPETPARAPNGAPANAVTNNICMLDSPSLPDERIVTPNNAISLVIRCLSRGVNIALSGSMTKAQLSKESRASWRTNCFTLREETSSKVKLQLGQIKAKCVRTWLDLEHQTARLGVVELLRNIRSGCGI